MILHDTGYGAASDNAVETNTESRENVRNDTTTGLFVTSPTTQLVGLFAELLSYATRRHTSAPIVGSE